MPMEQLRKRKKLDMTVVASSEDVFREIREL
jgi:hypothetical protein